MKTLNPCFIVLAIILSTLVVTQVAAEEIIDEDFESGSLPPGFVITNGDVTVASVGGAYGQAMLMYSYACVELPGSFDRQLDLIIEADVKINHPNGNFVLNALYDTIGGPRNNQPANSGYTISVGPWDGDNPDARLYDITNGTWTLLDGQPNIVRVNEWFHVQIEFYRDGLIRVMIDGHEQLSAYSVAHSVGPLSITGYGELYVDNVVVSRVSTGGCQYDATTLYLQNGRFRVSGGAYLAGEPVEFFLHNLCPAGYQSETAAAFYFNSRFPPVQEGFISIRNECTGLREAYIVEVACASTRRFYVDVYDTWTGLFHRYENPVGGSSRCFPADAISFRRSCP